MSSTTAAPTSFAVGALAQLIVVATDAKGAPISVPPAPVFTTSDPTIATVDAATGAVAFLAAGSVSFGASTTNPDGSVAVAAPLTEAVVVDVAALALSIVPAAPAAVTPVPAAPAAAPVAAAAS